MGNTVMGSSAMQHRDFLMVLIKSLTSQSNGHPPLPPRQPSAGDNVLAMG